MTIQLLENVRLDKTGQIDHFTVVCLVAWPLRENEAEVDLVLIDTSLLMMLFS